MELGLGCVHVRGRSGDSLPPNPFVALRLVFVDLHLSGQTGKAAASHTANVVKKVVSADSGPVHIVIWSKYASDSIEGNKTPTGDQPTEADIFKEMLLQAEPKFKSRLAFSEMAKPKLTDRPDASLWLVELKRDIQSTIVSHEAFSVLWCWEALIRESGAKVSETLASMCDVTSDGNKTINGELKNLLRLLSSQQAGPDISTNTALRHLVTVLAQIGIDIVEFEASSLTMNPQPNWLAESLDNTWKQKVKVSSLNGLLLTACSDPEHAPFVPGTVFDVTNAAAMTAMTGFSMEQLHKDCFDGKATELENFKNCTTPVLLELTPMCDFHQGHRRGTNLVAGLAFPSEMSKNAKSKDACKKTPVFEDKFSAGIREIGFVFCSRYRVAMPLTPPDWLKPRLRLRDSLVTDFRNWHSNQASRVGLLSF